MERRCRWTKEGLKLGFVGFVSWHEYLYYRLAILYAWWTLSLQVTMRQSFPPPLTYSLPPPTHTHILLADRTSYLFLASYIQWKIECQENDTSVGSKFREAGGRPRRWLGLVLQWNLRCGTGCYPLESLGTGKGANTYLFLLLNEGSIAILQYQVSSEYSSNCLP